MHPAWKIATRGARGTIVALMFVGTFSAACDSIAPEEPGPIPASYDLDLEMVVENRLAAPVKIMVLMGETPEHLGFVGALSFARFDIGRYLQGEPERIRILASVLPDGETTDGEISLEASTTWVSHYADLGEAEWVRLTVGSDLTQSSLEVGSANGSSNALGGAVAARAARPVRRSLPL